MGSCYDDAIAWAAADVICQGNISVIAWVQVVIWAAAIACLV